MPEANSTGTHSRSLSLLRSPLPFRAENACCDQLTLTYDCLYRSLFSASLCVCIALPLHCPRSGLYFVLFLLPFRYFSCCCCCYFAIVSSVFCLLVACNEGINKTITALKLIDFPWQPKQSSVKGLFYEFGNYRILVYMG